MEIRVSFFFLLKIILTLVSTINLEYKINKIYLDNYEQDIVSGFKTSTQTKYLLSEAVENGAMIVNYIGHGNEFFGLKKILDDNFIFNLNNRSKLLFSNCNL